MEALDSLRDVQLTEDEMTEAVIWAKNRKKDRLEKEKREKVAEENRRALTASKWPYTQTRDFMLYRAGTLFEGKFGLDDSNGAVFEMLCYYFSEDAQFVSLAENAGVKNPSLEKGILLVGNYGVGKSWLMKLFGKNQRQVFHVHNAKNIANEFEMDGQAALNTYLQKHKNAVNDVSSFYQTHAGLCIDDIGTEDVKNHFGNKKSVIGDIIEQRYAEGNTGIFLHGTTNLSADQIEEYYGPRVRSRVREIFNWIVVSGNDRRK